jgi:hypothetical protein
MNLWTQDSVDEVRGAFAMPDAASPKHPGCSAGTGVLDVFAFSGVWRETEP